MLHQCGVRSRRRDDDTHGQPSVAHEIFQFSVIGTVSHAGSTERPVSLFWCDRYRRSCERPKERMFPAWTATHIYPSQGGRENTSKIERRPFFPLCHSLLSSPGP